MVWCGVVWRGSEALLCVCCMWSAVHWGGALLVCSRHECAHQPRAQAAVYVAAPLL